MQPRCGRNPPSFISASSACAELNREPPAGRTYLAEVVARRTGLPQAEAEKRVDEAFAAAKDAEVKARAAADKARKMSAIAAFLAAATLLIACAAACAGAALGGRHRDEQIAAYMFGTRRFW